MNTEHKQRLRARDVMLPLPFIAIMLTLDAFGSLFERSTAKRTQTQSSKEGEESFTLDHPS